MVSSAYLLNGEKVTLKNHETFVAASQNPEFTFFPCSPFQSCGNRTSYCLFKKILLFTVRLTGVTMTLEVDNSTFPLSVGKPKPKFKQQPIIAKEDITSSAENEDKVTIGFSFEYDWLITRRDISGTNRVALLSKTKTITEYFGYISGVEVVGWPP